MPQAVINFLALLGWNSGTEQEIFSIDELISAFSFERCSKSGAKFDIEKAKWFNHQYLQLIPSSDIVDMFEKVLEEKGIASDRELTTKVVEMVKERATFASDIWEHSHFFFEAPTSYDEKAVRKRWKEDTPTQITELVEVIEGIEDFSSENLETIIKQWIQEKEYPLGGIMNAFRLAIVGESKGPHMFDIIALIGKNETISRLKHAVKVI